MSVFNKLLSLARVGTIPFDGTMRPSLLDVPGETPTEGYLAIDEGDGFSKVIVTDVLIPRSRLFLVRWGELTLSEVTFQSAVVVDKYSTGQLTLALSENQRWQSAWTMKGSTVTLTDTRIEPGRKDFFVSSWIKRAADSDSSKQVLVGQYDDDGVTWFEVYQQNGAIGIIVRQRYLGTYTNLTGITDPGLIAVGGPYAFWSITRLDQNLYVHVNGHLELTVSFTNILAFIGKAADIGNVSLPLHIGSAVGGANPFNGSIEDLDGWFNNTPYSYTDYSPPLSVDPSSVPQADQAPRLVSPVDVTESGDVTSWTYVSTTVENGGGRFDVEYPTDILAAVIIGVKRIPPVGGGLYFGVQTSFTWTPYIDQILYGILVHPDGNYYSADAGVYTNLNIPVKATDRLRLVREGTTISIIRLSSGPRALLKKYTGVPVVPLSAWVTLIGVGTTANQVSGESLLPHA
jgi:hypothetical protein